jgi:hypothetical protein
MNAYTLNIVIYVISVHADIIWRSNIGTQDDDDEIIKEFK